VYVTLEDGTAEVFGAEIFKGERVTVTGQKLAVYTWDGCKLKVEGEPTLAYQADNACNASYYNLHYSLNGMREKAFAEGAKARQGAQGQAAAGGEQAPLPAEAQGPRVIIVGPTDSGKSTLTKMLLNWAVRSPCPGGAEDSRKEHVQSWQPTFVDLDVGQGSITAPGCIAAVPIETQLDIEQGAGALDMPLVYWYAHTSASDNPELYKFLIDRLAAILDKRAAASPLAAASGLVVNTLGWVEGLGYELQIAAIHALKADVVVVMEQDRLYSQISAELKDVRRPIKVVKLDKSGGVVKREKEDRRAARDGRIKEYFYGVGGGLNPVTQTVRADSLMVFRVGGGPRAPTSALPIGAIATADPLRVTHMPVTPELTQGVLAVSHAPTPDQILSTNIAGFVLVRDVDVARGMVTFLAPTPGQLPGRYLVAGSLRTTIS